MNAPGPSSGLARALLPWLLLLPIALLAWPFPGAPLADDPFPHLAGTGWIALGSLPLALCLPFLGALRARGLRLLFGIALFVGLRASFGEPLDPFEARRMLVLSGTWCVLYAGGAALVGSGLRRYNRGLVIASVLWTLGAVARYALAEGGHLAGVLGDTGSLSQAALPGAAIGAWYVATRKGPFFGLGLLAVGLFIAHMGTTPVLAGGVALTIALVASVFLSHWARDKESYRRRLGLLAALTVFALVGLRGLDLAPAGRGGPLGEALAQDAVADADEEPVHDAHLGGVEVRARVWGRVPRLLASNPLFGVGPGQFQASFPVVRDPREIELSRHGPCSELLTEVEHAHADPLEGLAELGLVGGSLWIAFLILAARACLTALRGDDFRTIAMGAGALALLANALVHAPLIFNPAASAIGFTLFGALRAHEDRGPAPRLPRPLLAALAALGVLAAGLGWPLVAHGRALGATVGVLARIDELRVEERVERPAELDPAPRSAAPRYLEAELAAAVADARAAATHALESAPSSAEARLLAARLAAPEDRAAAWERALILRPHSVEALAGLGLAHARAGDVGAARARWEQALALSPTYPPLLRNLARLELFEGDPTSGLERLAALRAAGCQRPAFRTALGSELILSGRWDPGARVLLESPLDALVPEEVHAAVDAPEPGATAVPRRADALRALAHLLWARQHVAAGDAATAVRSYRQVLVPTRLLDPDGAPAARLELAAAELLAGREDDARAHAAGLEDDADAWAALPAWALDALGSAGLGPRE